MGAGLTCALRVFLDGLERVFVRERERERESARESERDSEREGDKEPFIRKMPVRNLASLEILVSLLEPPHRGSTLDPTP